MHAESFVVCIVGNMNTRYRNGVKVLWCHSPSSLVGFLEFHPYMCSFSFRKLCCDLFLLFFFVLLFRNGKREERWELGKAEGKMHGLYVIAHC